MARWHSCNVLKSEAQARQLWQFGGGKFNLIKAESQLPGEPLPDNVVGKDWHTLFQPRLNIAWIPADKVFLRVVQLPKADATETRSMVELQLEKISPLPVAQIVWSYEVVPMVRQGVLGQELQPHATGELQTVIVVMVARNYVEEFLGQIETQGYQPDRLELPQLDELLGLKIDADGVWILPGVGSNANACLVSWWYGGVLQYVGVLHLPSGESRAAALQEQFAQTTWAGETEGWITSEPRFTLVADEVVAANWLPLFEPAQNVRVVAPAPAATLAQVAARRVATNGKTTNLLPQEFETRYKQRFIDRLWMRALGSLVVLYLAGVVIYIGLAKFSEYRFDSLQREVNGLGVTYTNTLRLKEELTVMQDTLDLQYAALECYLAIAENLPEGLTLRTIRFDQGRKVTYSGAGTMDDRNKILELNEKMLRATMRDQPLFAKVNAPDIRNVAGGQGVTWSFACDLKRAEGQ
jgi:hypothetical protein